MILVRVVRMISGIGKVVCPNKRGDALFVSKARMKRRKRGTEEGNGRGRRRLCTYGSPLGDT